MTTRLIALLFCLFTGLSPVLAAGYGYGGSGSKGLNNSTTNQLVRFLERGIRLCRSLDSVYRYDCYRQNYSSAADKLAGNAAYAVPMMALQSVEQTLERVVAQNADPTARTVRKRGGTFRAVKPASTAKAKETFRRALDEAATVLLRSDEGAGTHFARIAKALDSNKILLRAMLRMIGRSPIYMLG